MRILFLGDIVGRPGRRIARQAVAKATASLGVDVVVANVENASGGVGIAAKTWSELCAMGIHVGTTGNHVWKHRDIEPVLARRDGLLRPANYPEPAPGTGMHLHSTPAGPVVVINLLGRTFMEAVDCPFAAADALVAAAPADACIVVDFHAEATSEKWAMAHFLRGRVHAVVGTHTHVPTRDATILDGMTGYITDVGMCGPRESCLGMDPKAVLARFRTGRPVRFTVADGPGAAHGVIIDWAEGRCVGMSPWEYTEGL
ncbi:MAG: YmdB family metallophosphoesterase [Desulfomicrobiaceae bacterium]|nr:YmdB family metallophosphoesterase [Desulfomicrobiaceae bacterium]